MWIPIIVICVLIIGVLAVFMVNKKKRHEIDYKAWFVIGIAWIPLGIATNNIGFVGMGAVFMTLGLKNKDKWGKKIKLSKKQTKQMKWAVLAGVVLLLVGVAVFSMMA
jgi:NO-binding membrane sensor protein with MHYT domain